jgi:hypothetical protein
VRRVKRITDLSDNRDELESLPSQSGSSHVGAVQAAVVVGPVCGAVGVVDVMGSELHGGYVDVDGLSVYDEVRGAGQPLVLLHGGWPTIELNFGDVVRRLDEDHGVVAVELFSTSRLSTTPRSAASRTAGYRYQRSPSNSKPIDSCPHLALASISHSTNCCRFPA